MLKRKIVVLLCCMYVLLNTLTVANASTTIGQDVSANNPLNSEMELEADLNLIRNDLSLTEGKVSFSEDRISGRFSTEVSIFDVVDEDKVEFLLVASEEFDTTKYSQVKLWIKPGNGAKWIEFYTNSKKIYSNGDEGIFKVGSNLISGQWNEVTLDLSKIENNTIAGKNLKVKTNDSSTWSYDNVSTEKAVIKTFNLANMINSSSEIFNGMLRLKTISEKNYDITPTILTTNNNLPEGNYLYKHIDSFSEDGRIFFNPRDICTGGSPIKSDYYSSSYPSSKAFDDILSSYWKSDRGGSSVSGYSYIGYDFGIPKNIKTIKIKQNGSESNSVTSVKIQYYDEITSMWIDLDNMNLQLKDSWQIHTVENEVQAEKWRLLANSSPTSRWDVYEIEMGESNHDLYISKKLHLPTITAPMGSSKVSWTGLDSSSVRVETRLSLDNGVTWQPWNEVTNDSEIPGINAIENQDDVVLQYRIIPNVSGIDYVQITDLSISIIGEEDGTSFNLGNGSISKIAIDSKYVGIEGNEMNLNGKNTAFKISRNASSLILSGDGKTAFFTNPIGPRELYRLNLLTGETSQVNNITYTKSIKSNYDGSIIAFIGSPNNSLYIQKLDQNIDPELIAIDVSDFTLQENGNLVYTDTRSSYPDGSRDIYCYFDNKNERIYTSGTGLSSKRFTSSTPKKGDIVFYSTEEKKLWISSKTANKWRKKELFTAEDYITRIYSNMDGSVLYLGIGINPTYYRFDVETKSLRKLNIDYEVKSVINVTDHDKLIILDTDNRYLIYDPTSDLVKEITPSDALATTGTLFDIDAGENLMLYRSTDGISTLYLQEAKSPERYLLSFDSKNSWQTYKNGKWQTIRSNEQPTADDFTTYGMSVDEVNAVTENDFKQLYEGGRQIYTVDISIYLTSIDTSTSPSIKSIKVICNESEYSVTNKNIGQAIYTAKKQDFSGEKWRKVNRLYPIEIQPKESSFYYFLFADGKYSYYDGLQWIEEVNGEITQMLTNVEANWSNIIAKGMSGEQLKSIPKEDLNTKLAYKNFSIVYCMKVLDKSTEKYSSKIVVDYVEEYFSSETLVLKIIATDGSLREFTGLTKNQVEDFMEWVYKRQHNMGPIFYTIKVGSTSHFMNYYTIQSITVDE
ncbi:MAG: hypothetical protein K9L62_04360 [Vallitaleaceae bacterium]|nr:hypothetical protein [Vallitaleaceae bacterium]